MPSEKPRPLASPKPKLAKTIAISARRVRRLRLLTQPSCEEWFVLRQDALLAQAQADLKWEAFDAHDDFLIRALRARVPVEPGAHTPRLGWRTGGGYVARVPRWRKQCIRWLEERGATAGARERRQRNAAREAARSPAERQRDLEAAGQRRLIDD